MTSSKSFLLPDGSLRQFGAGVGSDEFAGDLTPFFNQGLAADAGAKDTGVSFVDPQAAALIAFAESGGLARSPLARGVDRKIVVDGEPSPAAGVPQAVRGAVYFGGSRDSKPVELPQGFFDEDVAHAAAGTGSGSAKEQVYRGWDESGYRVEHGGNERKVDNGVGAISQHSRDFIVYDRDERAYSFVILDTFTVSAGGKSVSIHNRTLSAVEMPRGFKLIAQKHTWTNQYQEDQLFMAPNSGAVTEMIFKRAEDGLELRLLVGCFETSRGYTHKKVMGLVIDGVNSADGQSSASHFNSKHPFVTADSEKYQIACDDIDVELVWGHSTERLFPAPILSAKSHNEGYSLLPDPLGRSDVIFIRTPGKTRNQVLVAERVPESDELVRANFSLAVTEVTREKKWEFSYGDEAKLTIEKSGQAVMIRQHDEDSSFSLQPGQNFVRYSNDAILVLTRAGAGAAPQAFILIFNKGELIVQACDLTTYYSMLGGGAADPDELPNEDHLDDAAVDVAAPKDLPKEEYDVTGSFTKESDGQGRLKFSDDILDFILEVRGVKISGDGQFIFDPEVSQVTFLNPDGTEAASSTKVSTDGRALILPGLARYDIVPDGENGFKIHVTVIDEAGNPEWRTLHRYEVKVSSDEARTKDAGQAAYIGVAVRENFMAGQSFVEQGLPIRSDVNLMRWFFDRAEPGTVRRLHFVGMRADRRNAGVPGDYVWEADLDLRKTPFGAVPHADRTTIVNSAEPGVYQSIITIPRLVYREAYVEDGKAALRAHEVRDVPGILTVMGEHWHLETELNGKKLFISPMNGSDYRASYKGQPLSPQAPFGLKFSSAPELRADAEMQAAFFMIMPSLGLLPAINRGPRRPFRARGERALGTGADDRRHDGEGGGGNDGSGSEQGAQGFVAPPVEKKKTVLVAADADDSVLVMDEEAGVLAEGAPALPVMSELAAPIAAWRQAYVTAVLTKGEVPLTLSLDMPDGQRFRLAMKIRWTPKNGIEFLHQGEFNFQGATGIAHLIESDGNKFLVTIGGTTYQIHVYHGYPVLNATPCGNHSRHGHNPHEAWDSQAKKHVDDVKRFFAGVVGAAGKDYQYDPVIYAEIPVLTPGNTKKLAQELLYPDGTKIVLPLEKRGGKWEFECSRYVGPNRELIKLKFVTPDGDVNEIKRPAVTVTENNDYQLIKLNETGFHFLIRKSDGRVLPVMHEVEIGKGGWKDKHLKPHFEARNHGIEAYLKVKAEPLVGDLPTSAPIVEIESVAIDVPVAAAANDDLPLQHTEAEALPAPAAVPDLAREIGLAVLALLPQDENLVSGPQIIAEAFAAAGGRDLVAFLTELNHLGVTDAQDRQMHVATYLASRGRGK